MIKRQNACARRTSTRQTTKKVKEKNRTTYVLFIVFHSHIFKVCALWNYNEEEEEERKRKKDSQNLRVVIVNDR